LNIFLKPGELYIGKGAAVITTILGSCVSITMFNKRLKVGGICHALLPTEGPMVKDADRFHYVDGSISQMLTEFETMGIKRHEIEVKVFGGSDVIGAKHKKSVGQQNVEATLNVLSSKNLTIISSDFGGTQGRKIIFNTQTGRVLLKKLERMQNLS
jgi:chemotaxis protein CheD